MEQLKRRLAMKVVEFHKRNACKSSDLKAFEKFDSILMSLRESTYVSLISSETEITIMNKKYYLVVPVSEKEEVKIALDKIVLRRDELTALDSLLLWQKCEAGRVEECSYKSCVIELHEEVSSS
jgi:hypothetical protein